MLHSGGFSCWCKRLPAPINGDTICMAISHHLLHRLCFSRTEGSWLLTNVQIEWPAEEDDQCHAMRQYYTPQAVTCSDRYLSNTFGDWI